MSDKKYLIHHAKTDGFFTQGRRYEVTEEYVDDEGDDVFVVTDDDEEKHLLTKNPDSDGDSYKMWFHIEGQEDGV